MKHGFLSLFLVIASVIHSQEINGIESYFTLCNSIGHESEIITHNSVFLLNGKLVEDNINGLYGYVYFDENEKEDSLFFFNKCNKMVFQKEKYRYLIEYLKNNNMWNETETEQFKRLIKVRFFCYDYLVGKYNSYIATFPVSWFLNCQESYFFNTNIRITSLPGNNYLISISTFGRYWSFHIEGNRPKSIKKKLIKKHKKLYGQF